jgi:hypothetical protein
MLIKVILLNNSLKSKAGFPEKKVEYFEMKRKEDRE